MQVMQVICSMATSMRQASHSRMHSKQAKLRLSSSSLRNSKEKHVSQTQSQTCKWTESLAALQLLDCPLAAGVCVQHPAALCITTTSALHALLQHHLTCVLLHVFLAVSISGAPRLSNSGAPRLSISGPPRITIAYRCEYACRPLAWSSTQL